MRKLNLTGFVSLLLLGAASLIGCADGDTSATGSKVASGDQSATAPAKTDPAKPVDSADTFEKAEPAAALSLWIPNQRHRKALAPEMDMEEPSELSQASDELVIGDTAPAIAISKWVNGEPFDSYTKDKVHVVEFWATWCGPCLASMPHLASLQEEYGEKVAFVGVTAEDDETVSGFMQQKSNTSDKKWSEVLTYRIALDDEGKTNAAFMEAAGQNGIPCAFIVGKTGLIEWIGHPAEIDEPLNQIVAGNWDSEKAKLLAKEAKDVRDALNEIGPKVDEAVSSGDFAKAVSLVDGLIARFPSNTDLPMIRFQCLIGGGMSDEANKTGKSLIENAKEDARLLDQLAWMMATGPEAPGIDFDLALSAAQKAVDLTKEEDISAIETMARVQFRQGKNQEAIASQKKTLTLARNPRQVQQLTAGLKKYEESLTPKEAAAPAEPDAESKEETPAEPEAKEEVSSEPEAK